MGFIVYYDSDDGHEFLSFMTIQMSMGFIIYDYSDNGYGFYPL